ncbi:MAG: UDP-N-acetylmuramate:L-alanyl-gamma-D-glutamyl-meso-diaminopimelate ligase [Verrucomicrobiales bacterium]
MEEERVHFLGICGTAMGSVAAAFSERGYCVTGSDADVYPPMSTFLEEKGIELSSGYRPENIPDDVDVVVVGNVISRGNPELEEVLERKLRYVSLPEIVKEHFLRGRRNVVVTGTHGKTTTSSMAAWLLESAGLEPSYMIGGIPSNLGRGARFTDSNYVVLEGDEYDTAFFDKRSKFLHYLPEILIVNNIEFDHADIFSSIDEIKLSFRRLLNIVPRNGVVFVNGDDANCLEVAESCPTPVAQVGFGEDCDIRIEALEYMPGKSAFTLNGARFEVPMDGEFNVRNAAMALCAGRFLGVAREKLRTALSGFEGIARRQQVRGQVRGITIIDDFAHHPSAMRQAIPAIRQHFPDSRVWAVFEPRSNTTKRNFFQQELPEALALADGAVVAAVAQPEKVPIGDRLDAPRVVRELERLGKRAHYGKDTDSIVASLRDDVSEGDVIVVFSNGGFGGLHERLLAEL